MVNVCYNSITEKSNRNEKDSFQRYSTLSIHFYNRDVSDMLKSMLQKMARMGKSFSLLDLGCGDGALLFSLQNQGLLNNADKVVGVDISEVRVKRLLESVSGVKGLVSDACKVEELDDGSFDVIICSQLIEHIPDEQSLLSEIRRLLKKDGWAYISSVIKKPYGLWVYRRDGEFRLDPTHVREYRSKENFLLLLEKEGFNPEKMSYGKVKYSVADLLVHGLVMIGLFEPEGIQTIFLRRWPLARFRKFLELPVLGYERIEILASLARNSRK